MSEFEYVMGFHTIVLGLATARLLGTIADTIKYRDTVGHFWVHTAWAVLLQLTLIGWWYALWRIWSDFDGELRYGDFLVGFSITVSYFLATHLLHADIEDRREMDLETHFFSIRVPMFLCLAWPGVLGVLELLAATVTTRPLPGLEQLTTFVEFAAVIVAALVCRSRRAHEIIVVAHAVGYLAIEAGQAGIGG